MVTASVLLLKIAEMLKVPHMNLLAVKVSRYEGPEIFRGVENHVSVLKAILTEKGSLLPRVDKGSARVLGMTRTI